MKQNRPPIPEDLKRRVRQKCKFGCVICGCPICDYDHIEDWSLRNVHDINNLTLLCTLHHRQKTNGILSRQLVKKRTEEITITPNYGLQGLNFENYTLSIGNNFISSLPKVYFGIYQKDYFSLAYDKEIKQIVVNAKFYDLDDNLSFQVSNNIYSAGEDVWDAEMKGNTIIIRETKGKVQLQIKLDGNNNTITLLGKFYYKENKYLAITSQGIKCNGYNLMSGCEVLNCNVGLLIAPREVLAGAAFYNGNHTNDRAGSSVTAFGLDTEYLDYLYSKAPGKD